MNDARIGFFADPAMDRFAAVLLNLASELWVQTERVATLTELVERAGLATPETLKSMLAEPETDARREAELKSFVDRLFAPLREPAASR